MTGYYQPSNFVRPKRKKVGNLHTDLKSTYQKDFSNKNPQPKRWSKINYDNLIVGNPGVTYDKTTTYRRDHSNNKPDNKLIGPENYKNNRQMYDLIKKKNHMTHAFNGDRPDMKETEYRANYYKKQAPQY